MADGPKDVPTSDVHEMRSALEEFSATAKEVAEFGARLNTKVSADGFSTEEGFGFLDVKNHLLLSYNIDLCLLMLRKLQGKLIAGSPPLHRLMELRVFLEKLRPLDQKFRYHIDKAIRSTTSSTSHKDPLHFRANPHNLAKREESSSSEDDTDQQDGHLSSSQPNIYVPPKVMAVPYEDSEPTGSGKRVGGQERRRRQALHSSLLRDLRGEYSEAPQEEGLSLLGTPQERGVQQRQEEYEEDNFVRLPIRHKGRGHGPSSTFDEVVQFGNVNALFGELTGSAQKKPRLSPKKGAKKRRFRQLRRRRQ